MKNLEYTITIGAPREKVWKTMLGRDTYPKWTSVAWPGSSYEGDWSEGSVMRFGDGGGTVARVTSAKPYDRIALEHFAVLNPDNSEDTESDMAKGWIGTTESYTLTEQDGSTELVVGLEVHPDWISMFDEGWPVALPALKELAEAS